MTRWRSPSFEIRENDQKRFEVIDLNNNKCLATFLMFADARDFTQRRMVTDSLDLAASALSSQLSRTGGQNG